MGLLNDVSVNRDYSPCSSSVFLELPVTVVERADLTGLQPSGDAVEMESVLYTLLDEKRQELYPTHIADAPGDGTFFSSGSSLVCLTFDA